MSDQTVVMPEPIGFGTEMHGAIVLFSTLAEKKVGLSPGARTPLYTADQLRAAVLAEREAFMQFLRDMHADHNDRHNHFLCALREYEKKVSQS